MIANITTGKKAENMILYNENKVSNGTAEKLFASTPVMMNKKGSIDVLNEYGQKTRTEDAMVQISLSLSIGENLNNDDFEKVARDYLELAGFKDTPFVVYRHHDTKQEHLHICTSLVNHDGKKINTYYQYIESQKATRKLEKKYGLKMVSSFRKESAGEGRDMANEYVDMMEIIKGQEQASRADHRKLISKASRTILNNYRPTTFPELKKLYQTFGIELREVKNPDDTHKGYVFRVAYLKEKTFVKASDLSFAFNEKMLAQKFKKNAARKGKTKATRISGAIDRLKRNYDKMSAKDFADELQKKSILPIYDRYADGKAYGLSFLDQKTGTIFKASEVGKEYSIGQLSEFTSDSMATVQSRETLLFNGVSKLYKEFSEQGIRLPMLDFLKMEDTRSNLILELRGHIPDNAIGAAVDDFIARRIVAAEENKELSEAKRTVVKALEDYYSVAIRNHKKEDPDNDAISYVMGPLEEDRDSYLNYVSENVPQSGLFRQWQLDKILDEFIDAKQQSEPLKPLREAFVKESKEFLGAFLDTVETTGESGRLDALIKDKKHIISVVKNRVLYKAESDSVLDKYTAETIGEQLDAVVDKSYKAMLHNEKKKVVKERIEAIVSNIKDPEGNTKKLDQLSFLMLDEAANKNKLLEMDLLGTTSEEHRVIVDLEFQRVKDVVIPMLQLGEDVKKSVEILMEQRPHRAGDPDAGPFYIDGNEVKKLTENYAGLENIFGSPEGLKEHIEREFLRRNNTAIVSEYAKEWLESLKEKYLKENVGSKYIDFVNAFAANGHILVQDAIRQKMAQVEPYFRYDIVKHQAFLSELTKQLENRADYVANVQMPLANLAEQGREYIRTVQKKIKAKGYSSAQMYQFFSSTRVRAQLLSEIEKIQKDSPLLAKLGGEQKYIDKLRDGHTKIFDFYADAYMHAATVQATNNAIDIVGDMFDAQDNKRGLNTAMNDGKKKKKGPKY